MPIVRVKIELKMYYATKSCLTFAEFRNSKFERIAFNLIHRLGQAVLSSRFCLEQSDIQCQL